MAGPNRNETWDQYVADVAEAPKAAKRFHEATLAAIPAFEKAMDRIHELMREEGLTREEATQKVVQEALSGWTD